MRLHWTRAMRHVMICGMGVALRVVVAAAAFALGPTACSVLTDLNGLSGGDPDPEAAGVLAQDARASDPDAPLEATASESGPDAAEAGADAATDELFFDSFENGVACAGWAVSYGTAQTVDGGYDGAHACLLCPTGDMYADKDVSDARLGAASLELWAKRVDSTPAGANAYGYVIFYTSRGEEADNGMTTLTDTWTPIHAIRSPSENIGNVKFRLRSDDACFLVDAVRARYLR